MHVDKTGQGCQETRIPDPRWDCRLVQWFCFINTFNSCIFLCRFRQAYTGFSWSRDIGLRFRNISRDLCTIIAPHLGGMEVGIYSHLSSLQLLRSEGSTPHIITRGWGPPGSASVVEDAKYRKGVRRSVDVLLCVSLTAIIDHDLRPRLNHATSPDP